MFSRRRIAALAVAAILSLYLAGCSESPDASSSNAESSTSEASLSAEAAPANESSSTAEQNPPITANSSEVVNSIGSKDSAASPGAEKTTPADVLRLGETKATDDYELTITSAGWQDEVYPNTDSGQTYMYFADEDGKSYYVVEFTYKNLGDSFYQMKSIAGGTTTEQSIKFNDKYAYGVDVYDPDVSSLFTSAITYSIEPFDTKRFYLIASVADEIRESFKCADLTWQFNKIETSDGENYTVLSDVAGNYTAHFE